jgi:peptidoglycan/LPS O-acetylase OafA/YrhL
MSSDPDESQSRAAEPPEDRAGMAACPGPTGNRARYDMLDGWRGLAAFAVLLHHMNILSYGPEAVMLFFVISGYCITAASESGLQRRMPFRTFMWRRVRRIYPPYLLSLAFFVATRVVKQAMTGNGFPKITPLQWLQNLTLTQWLSLPSMWPMQAVENKVNVVTAYWSLQYEEQFYLVVALTMFAGLAAGRWITAALMAVSAGVVLTVSHRGATGFFVDYWFHFGVGAVVFYRLCRMRPGVIRLALDLGIVAGAAACCILAFRHHADVGRPIWRELAIVITFAAVLVWARPFDARFVRTRVGRALMALGMISYSLYLIHQFNLVFAASVAARLWPGGPASGQLCLQMAIHLGIATGFWYLCERPFLNRRPPIIASGHHGRATMTTMTTTAAPAASVATRP